MTLPVEKRGAVLWDMDGVICDSASCHHLAWNRMMAGRGVMVTDEVFRGGFGRRTDAFIRSLVGSEVPPSEVQKIALEKESYFRQIVRGCLEPLPGVISLLNSLREAGYPMALASSAPRANIDLTLTDLKITGFFETVVSGDDVTDGKPSPQIFLLAAERLGVVPARCLVIEDAVVGITAARRAGMFCLAVTNTYPADRLGAADMVVDSLTEVNTGVIEAIFEKSKGVEG